MTALTAVGGVLVLVGGLFSVTGGVGLLRFPDFYTRLHAAGVTDTAGAGFVLFGLCLVALGRAGGWVDVQIAIKLLVILFFLWVTGTTACHALAKAAFLAGVEPWKAEDGGPSKG